MVICFFASVLSFGDRVASSLNVIIIIEREAVGGKNQYGYEIRLLPGCENSGSIRFKGRVLAATLEK